MLDFFKRRQTSTAISNPTPLDIIHASVLPWEAIRDDRSPQAVAQEYISRYAGTVAVCVDRISQAVASTPLKVMRRRTGKGKPLDPKTLDRMKRLGGPKLAKALARESDLEEVDDKYHPLIKLLESCFTHIETVQGHVCLTGNAYWLLIDGPNGYPIDIHIANPADMRVLKDRETFIAGYVYGRGVEVEQTFAREAVVHFRNPNFQSEPWYGRGDVEKCVIEADMARLMVAHGLATLGNGATPGQIIMPEAGTTWTETVKDKIAALIRAKYTGTDKAGRTMVTGTRMEIVTPQPYQRELSYIVTGDQMRDRICNVFGVPVALLTLDTAALANAREADPQFQRYAVLPRLNRIQDALNEQLVQRFRDALKDDSLIVAFDNPSHDEEVEKYGALQAAAGGPILTVNEARDKLGLPPVKGGENIAKPDAGGLGGLFAPRPAGNQPDQPATRPPDPGNPSITSNSSNEPKDDALGKGYGGEMFRHAASCACCDVHPRTTRAGLAKDDKRDKLQSAEDELLRSVQQWFNYVFGSIVVDADGTVRLVPPFGQTTDAFAESFARLVSNPLARASLLGHTLGATELPVKAPTYADFNAPAIRQLQTNTLQLADQILQTAEGAIRESIADAISRGEGIQGIRAAVQSVAQSASGYAAERIAQTESTRAFCAGRERGWKDTGAVSAKEWLLSGNPCPLCVALKGRKVGLDEPFARAGQTIKGFTFKEQVNNPPGHPNCRCDIGAVFKDLENKG